MLYFSTQSEAVVVEVTSPQMEDSSTFDSSAVAQVITPWDVKGATVEGKQVRQ